MGVILVHSEEMKDLHLPRRSTIHLQLSLAMV